MKLRQMTTAFIRNGDKVLLMKKENSELADGMFWSGLGGHMELEEINSPKEACIREIYEESGLTKHDINGLTMRYILIRVKGDEIRQQYVFFGSTERDDFIASDEGELHWKHMDCLDALRFSKIIAFMLAHYKSYPNLNHVMVGVITKEGLQEPYIQWSIMADPVVF